MFVILKKETHKQLMQRVRENEQSFIDSKNFAFVCQQFSEHVYTNSALYAFGGFLVKAFIEVFGKKAGSKLDKLIEGIQDARRKHSNPR